LKTGGRVAAPVEFLIERAKPVLAVLLLPVVFWLERQQTPMAVFESPMVFK